jgi:tetratricopeptide (TPR) repeat protein
MIWKIGSGLCASQPIFGYGTHRFEKAYNLAQAEYFQSGNASESEQFSAAHVTVSYNDYLLTFIEGGGIGFALFVAFIGSLLILCFSQTPKSGKTVAALTGVLTFSVMSLFSSQLFISALFSLMLMYAAILCSTDTTFGFAFQSKHKFLRWILGICLSALGLFFFNSQSNMAIAAHRIRVAMSMAKKEKTEKAINLLEKQVSILYFSDQLWCSYASVLQHSGKYQEALDKYKIAENLTSDPDLFLQMSDCYAELGQYDNAIKKCSLAMNIVPSKIRPRFTLMNLYIAKQDSSTAKKLAYEVLAQMPKGISKDADFYKKEAQKYIDSMKKYN